jgi:alkylhydroperoxidase family enzyme
MSRLPAATRETFPDELKYVWDRTMAGPTGAANIFATMGNNPEVLRGYLRCGNALWASCGLDVKTRELVILRCAYLKNSAYEWHQHVRIGRDSGLSDAQMNNLKDWAASNLYSPAERALLAYADSLNVSNHPGGAVYDALAKHFDPSTIVGVTILVAFYFATAAFLGALEVETETPFVGWEI